MMTFREFVAEVRRMQDGRELPGWASMPTLEAQAMVWVRKYETPARYVADSPYGKYLASPGWRKRRAVVLILSRGLCLCGAQARDVHHIDYVRKGAEMLRDLMPLCRTCHECQHGGIAARITGSLVHSMSSRTKRDREFEEEEELQVEMYGRGLYL